MTNPSTLSFYDAAGTVTGSRYHGAGDEGGVDWCCIA